MVIKRILLAVSVIKIMFLTLESVRKPDPLQKHAASFVLKHFQHILMIFLFLGQNQVSIYLSMRCIR